MMLHRLARDERGMVMGLAVIMIVLISVMGAGLLVFVNRDLEAVVEVNQGQKAFEIAEAGVQAAKQQILSDNIRQHYDGVHTNDCAAGQRLGEDWSPSTIGYPNRDCTGTPASKPAGVTKTFAGGKFTVTIECFDQASDGALDPCAGIATPAPDDDDEDDNDDGEDDDGDFDEDDDCGDDDDEGDDDDSDTNPGCLGDAKKTFFRVVSTGFYPSDGSGAKRRIEAIYNTYDLAIPKAFYTPSTALDSVTISGTATAIKDVSIFTKGGVKISGSPTFSGTDIAYKRWAATPTDATNSYPNSYNSVPRSTATPGIGAAKNIGSPVSGRDYGANTVPALSYPRVGSGMTFPFNPDSQPDIEVLRAEAIRQEQETGEDHYRNVTGGGVENLTSWPTEVPGRTTVVFYKFTNAANVQWMVNASGTAVTPDGCKGPIKNGILVVENGTFTTQPNNALFRGIVIVRGGSVDGQYDDTGNNTCLEGYANADGTIKLAGNVSPSSSVNVLNTPGFYGVRLWSWRELYE